MLPKVVTDILINAPPQLDTIVALWLIKKFGKHYFTGLDSAKIKFSNTLPPNRTVEQLQQEGCLLIDIGHGPFDHHPGSLQEARKLSASQEVAERLGIHTQRSLAKLLALVNRDETGQPRRTSDSLDSTFSLPSLFLRLRERYPDEPMQLVYLITELVDAYHTAEMKRFTEMTREYAELASTGRIRNSTIRSGRYILKIISVQSDIAELIGHLRAVKNLRFDLYIQRNSRGQITILSNQARVFIDLRRVVAKIRTAEFYRRTPSHTIPSRDDLESPGQLETVPEWYYDSLHQNLFTARSAENSALSLNEVIELIVETLPTLPPSQLKPPRLRSVKRNRSPKRTLDRQH